MLVLLLYSIRPLLTIRILITVLRKQVQNGSLSSQRVFCPVISALRRSGKCSPTVWGEPTDSESGFYRVPQGTPVPRHCPACMVRLRGHVSDGGGPDGMMQAEAGLALLLVSLRGRDPIILCTSIPAWKRPSSSNPNHAFCVHRMNDFGPTSRPTLTSSYQP
jgi:hypothetical protein